MADTDPFDGLTGVTVGVDLTPDYAKIDIEIDGGAYIRIGTSRTHQGLLRLESALDSLPELIIAAIRGEAGQNIGPSVLVMSHTAEYKGRGE